MALPSFILAPGSKSWKNGPVWGMQLPSWGRKTTVLPSPCIREVKEGRKGEHDAPSPSGHISQCPSERGKKHFCISLKCGRKSSMKICEIHNTVCEEWVIFLFVLPGVHIANFSSRQKLKIKNEPGAPSGVRSVTTSAAQIERSLQTHGDVEEMV